jgi:hypothetical protein
VMLVGFAANKVIAGTDPFPEGALVELTDPQPDSSAHTNRTRIRRRKLTSSELSLRLLRLVLLRLTSEDMSVASMRPAAGRMSLCTPQQR